MKKIVYSLLLLLFCSHMLWAQSEECGNQTYEQELNKKDPSFQINKAKLDAFVKKYIREHGVEAKSGNKYIIPIVFHVIHYYGTEDISDAQIYDEVKILNRDYNKRNADTSKIIPQFKNIADKMPIEFRLATKDPDGNCTNGIDRYVTLRTNQGSDISKLYPWPRSQYLNVWTVKTIGAQMVAGYAYTPPSVAPIEAESVDGILILSNYIGSIGTGSVNTSRALTHEIGHYYGLLHPWGTSNDPEKECGDDEIFDTPFTKGFDRHCPVYGPGSNLNVYSLCTHRIFNVGTTTSAAQAMGSPFNSDSGKSCKTQYLISAYEMDSARIFGTYIDSISMSVTNNNASTIRVPNVSIKMGITNKTSLDTTFDTSPLTTYFSSAAVNIPHGTSTLTFKLSSLFFWEDTVKGGPKKNVIIQFCHDSIPGGQVILTPIYSSKNGIYSTRSHACDSSTTGIKCGRPALTFNCRTIENYQNFMDYSYCSVMFTHGQVMEVEAVLNNNMAQRNNLWQPGNLELTGIADTSIHTLCVPHPDFYTTLQNNLPFAPVQMFCSGTNVTFTDASWPQNITTGWHWDFGADATPTTSNAKNPGVSFSTAGWKTITLTVSNASGSNTVTKQNYIYITDASAPQYSGGYAEDFEGGSLEIKGWIVLNPENNNSQWALSSEGSAGYGTHCVKLNNYKNMPSDIDILVSPSLDLSSFGSSAYLHFSYNCAAASIDTANLHDLFNIYASTNCGKSWGTGAKPAIKTITKVPLTNAAFYPYEYNSPNSYLWKEVSIPLNSSYLTSNVRFRFEYNANGRGNNIYLDNIFISNHPTGVEEIDENSFSAIVFPNPASGNASLVVSTPAEMKATISMYDVTGRKIARLYEGTLTEGTQSFEINPARMALKGMYLINIEGNNQVIRKKIIFF